MSLYTVEHKKGSKYPWRVRFTSPQGLSTILASFPTESQAKVWVMGQNLKEGFTIFGEPL